MKNFLEALKKKLKPNKYTFVETSMKLHTSPLHIVELYRKGLIKASREEGGNLLVKESEIERVRTELEKALKKSI